MNASVPSVTQRVGPVSDAHPPGIGSISVAGFKSIVEEGTLEVRPLTLLAGANSSGKSSMMQPLLLLKQTLEAQYDPGPLLLNGPNVKFTEADQLLSKTRSDGTRDRFSVTLSAVNPGRSIQFGFRKPDAGDRQTLELEYNRVALGQGETSVKADSTLSDFLLFLGPDSNLADRYELLRVVRDRSFFAAELAMRTYEDARLFLNIKDYIAQFISDVIHVPSLRGTRERIRPVSGTGPRFPGTFDFYAATLVEDWGRNARDESKGLDKDLEVLGLAGKIQARRVNEAFLELHVGSLSKTRRGEASEMMNLADVGFGVSQILPVLVALRAAERGQLVHIEEPEIHLHPRAQVALAKPFAEAAMRGVRVVVETHSSLLLLGIQTSVAEGNLDPSMVGLNWFGRENGKTRIQAAEVDEAGRFGDWPEDFAVVALEEENRYLTAAERRLAKAR